MGNNQSVLTEQEILEDFYVATIIDSDEECITGSIESSEHAHIDDNFSYQRATFNHQTHPPFFEHLSSSNDVTFNNQMPQFFEHLSSNLFAPQNHYANTIDNVVSNYVNDVAVMTGLNDILAHMFLTTHGQTTERQPMHTDSFSRFDQVKYSSIIGADKDVDCTICKNEYQNDSFVIQLPCGHFFDVECIKKWMTDYHNSCPMCREKY